MQILKTERATAILLKKKNFYLNDTWFGILSEVVETEPSAFQPVFHTWK